MWRLAWTQARRRGLRSAALFAAVLLASVGFTLLTGASDASSLQTLGTVQDQSRTSYDILVRPEGSRSAVEDDQGVVQSGFLSGRSGGIRLSQWRQIQRLPGVEVAAPIAMVGYAVPLVRIPVDLTTELSGDQDVVARVDASWSTDNGLSASASPPDFLFVTSKPLRFLEGNTGDEFYGVELDGHENKICPIRSLPRPLLDEDRPSVLRCMSRDGSGDERSDFSLPADGLGLSVSYPFPFLVAAVDPASEEALSGLDGAVTSGQPLSGGVQPDARSTSEKAVPVLVADAPATELQLDLSASLVDSTAVSKVLADAHGNQLRSLPSQPVLTQTLTSAEVYPQLLQSLAQGGKNYYDTNNVSKLLLVGTPDYRPRSSARLGMTAQDNTIAEQVSDPYTQGAPAMMGDVAVRQSTTVVGPRLSQGLPRPATLRLQGTFDPGALEGVQGLTDRLLSGLATAEVTGADDGTRSLLGERPLAPAPDVAGFAQPAPLMLTTLDALEPFQAGWSRTTQAGVGQHLGDPTDPDPISAIRVRVAGVDGVDDVSRERVRLVADRIQRSTGLSVDVTVGSSPYSQQLELPAGNYGRPALAVEQSWIKKGVATTIITALDRKSLAIFVLVLLISGLSVANSATASVRARRRELGILTSLGWRPRHVFRLVMAELVIVAGAAGIAATAITLLVARVADLPGPWWRPLLALPVALLVVALAGLAPAALAARVRPLAAVRPAVATRVSGLGRRVSGPVGLAITNLRRTPARNLLAAAGLTVATAAFAVLLAITLAFQGAAVGTVMGDAVTLQVRTADYAAVAATLLLAVLGVATVMALNMRDRGSELAVLQATGWRDRDVSRLVVLEGTITAVVGVVPGLLLGIAIAAGLTGTVTPPVLVACALAGLVAVAATALAAIAPALLVRRLPTALLLTEETA